MNLIVTQPDTAFEVCLRAAKWIVRKYRAEAPEGFDPVNLPSASAPAPRNLTKEMLQTLSGYQKTAPGYLGLEQQYQPAYGRLSLTNQAQQQGGFVDAQGVYHPGTIGLQAQQRAADIAQVAALGPYATAAFLQANPFLASSLQNLQGRTQNSQILQTLNRQAQNALAQGGQLSPQDIRTADQTARAAFAARGLVGSSPAAAAEILNRDAAVRQRLAAAQEFASGVQGLNQQQADLVGRASQIFSTTLSDPFQAILGRSSGAGGGGAGPSYPQQIGVGAQLFNPTNPYAADVYNTNYNAQAAANIANANQQAGLESAGIGAAGAILGGFLAGSDKRIKTDIKSTGKKTVEGVPIKTFRYKHDKNKRRYAGVIAQDLEKVNPGAVITHPVTGIKMINHAMTRSPFALLTAGGKAA